MLGPSPDILPAPGSCSLPDLGMFNGLGDTPEKQSSSLVKKNLLQRHFSEDFPIPGQGDNSGKEVRVIIVIVSRFNQALGD